MKKLFLLLFFATSIIIVRSQGYDTLAIKKIEINAIQYNQYCYTPATIDDIENKYGQFVRIINEDDIENSKIYQYLSILKENKSSYYTVEKAKDFVRAIINIYYSASEETIYLTDKGLVRDGKLYMKNYLLVNAIYSFFPDSFFERDINLYPDMDTN